MNWNVFIWKSKTMHVLMYSFAVFASTWTVIEQFICIYLSYLNKTGVITVIRCETNREAFCWKIHLFRRFSEKTLFYRGKKSHLRKKTLFCEKKITFGRKNSFLPNRTPVAAIIFVQKSISLPRTLKKKHKQNLKKYFTEN